MQARRLQLGPAAAFPRALHFFIAGIKRNVVRCESHIGPGFGSSVGSSVRFVSVRSRDRDSLEAIFLPKRRDQPILKKKCDRKRIHHFLQTQNRARTNSRQERASVAQAVPMPCTAAKNRRREAPPELHWTPHERPPRNEAFAARENSPARAGGHHSAALLRISVRTEQEARAHAWREAVAFWRFGGLSRVPLSAGSDSRRGTPLQS